VYLRQIMRARKRRQSQKQPINSVLIFIVHEQSFSMSAPEFENLFYVF